MYQNPTIMLWLMVGLFASLVVPWYGIEDGFFGFEWIIDGHPVDSDTRRWPFSWPMVKNRGWRR